MELEDDKKINESKEILLQTNKFNEDGSVIEAKLPNPYLNTECVGNKRFISLKLKSKYKSKFADYFKKKGNTKDESSDKNIKSNKTFKYQINFDKNINFTHLKEKYRSSTNKINLIKSTKNIDIIREEENFE